MPAYTANVPQANQTIAASQPIINNNFQYLISVGGPPGAGLLRDHNMTLNTANAGDGVHKQVTFQQALATFPSITGAVSALYPKNVSAVPQLFYYDGTDEIQITFAPTGTTVPTFSLAGSITFVGNGTTVIPDLPSLSAGSYQGMRDIDLRPFGGMFGKWTGLDDFVGEYTTTSGSGFVYSGTQLAIINNNGPHVYHYTITYVLTV